MRIFLIITLFFSIKTYCQNTMTSIIVDIETKRPISYAGIEILENGTTIYSDGFGRFTIGLNDDEKLKISHIGYTPMHVTKKLIGDTIFLKKQTIKIDEVVVFSGSFKERTIGYIKKKKTLRWHIKQQTQLATLIKYENKIKKAYIKKILIPISKNITRFKGGKFVKTSPDFQSVLRIHVYENKNEKPSRNLLIEPILVNCNQNTDEILKIDISNEFIEFPANGVFISVEMIGELDGQGKVIYDNNKRSNLPSFRYTKKNAKNIVSVSFIKRIFGNSKWEKIDKEHTDFSMLFMYSMALSLELSIHE